LDVPWSLVLGELMISQVSWHLGGPRGERHPFFPTTVHPNGFITAALAALPLACFRTVSSMSFLLSTCGTPFPSNMYMLCTRRYVKCHGVQHIHMHICIVSSS